MKEQDLSQAIENRLVAQNLRHMQTAQAALTPGYYLRAANLLRGLDGRIIIGTGFPVGDSFETDGPVGAIALYDTLATLGAEPWLACAPRYRRTCCASVARAVAFGRRPPACWRRSLAPSG